jgi:hypothetical protein
MVRALRSRFGGRTATAARGALEIGFVDLAEPKAARSGGRAASRTTSLANRSPRFAGASALPLGPFGASLLCRLRGRQPGLTRLAIDVRKPGAAGADVDATQHDR